MGMRALIMVKQPVIRLEAVLILSAGDLVDFAMAEELGAASSLDEDRLSSCCNQEDDSVIFSGTGHSGPL